METLQQILVIQFVIFTYIWWNTGNGYNFNNYITCN